MLTENIIHIVEDIDNINKKLSGLCTQRDDCIYTVKQILGDYGYIEITGLSVVDSPYGVKDEDGRYVNEYCEDSLFCPDGGRGEEYIPIENGQYLKVDYIY